MLQQKKGKKVRQIWQPLCCLVPKNLFLRAMSFLLEKVILSCCINGCDTEFTTCFFKHFSKTSKWQLKLNLELSYETQSLQEFKILERFFILFTYSPSRLLLQIERVSEIHLPVIWRPKFQNPHRDGELSNQQLVKKLNLWGKTAVDKSAWINAYVHMLA